MDPAVTVPLTPAQVLLPPSFGGSDGNIYILGGCSGHSDRALRHHQDWDNLTHILSVVSLTNIPHLIKPVVGRLTTIARLRVAKSTQLETLRLLDGSVPLPKDINDLLYLSRYADLYARACGDNTTKTMWYEMKMENYEIFYLTDSFTVENFTEKYVEHYIIRGTFLAS